jgi:hypothetical protein
MWIISEEEFKSTFQDSLENGVNEDFRIDNFKYVVVSKEFDFMRLLSMVDCFYDIKPTVFRKVLADCSEFMGDTFLGLSFVGFPHLRQMKISRDFLISTDELREKSINSLIDEANLLSPEGCRYSAYAALYSKQGLWAAVLKAHDHYGTIGMKKEFVDIIRCNYPQLDQELDAQFFEFVRWYNMEKDMPDEWRYTIGDDLMICDDYFREIIKYLNGGNYDEGEDLIEAYRNKYFSMPFANDSFYLD